MCFIYVRERSEILKNRNKVDVKQESFVGFMGLGEVGACSPRQLRSRFWYFSGLILTEQAEDSLR